MVATRLASRHLIFAVTAALFVLAGCTAQAQQEGGPQEAFWSNLQELCGEVYEGAVTAGDASDSTFARERLVMHVRECGEDEVRIPFHVGSDRSRTWIVSRTEDGLRLKHDHRHEDGSEDEITQYGGDTVDEGSEGSQDFHADEHTAALIPPAAANVWTMEVHPGTMFAYALRRENEGRHFRAEFDLTQPVTPPPAPWGYEEDCEIPPVDGSSEQERAPSDTTAAECGFP